MDFDVEYSIQDEAQFWAEVDDILSTAHQSHEQIDNALRSWISFTASHRVEYLTTEDDIVRCALKLVNCPLFNAHQTYIRTQIVYGLLQEDDAHTLHLLAAFLLVDGRQHEESFDMLNTEGGFGRLVELIRDSKDDDLGLHRRLLELMYEMSRIQRLSRDDLMIVDDAFILLLFQIIESLYNDVNDPYHYPVIRVLLVLNEQYMVASNLSGPENSTPITNRVIKVLSMHGNEYKTFGENIILLLNRESETSLQLLILKLLYILFNTPPTLEYFYTNDLHVLVDILLRNLLDLPSEGEAAANLRHTYLRVLNPLLVNTQLKYPPHYKRDEIRQVLFMLANVSHAHFAPADATTIRLVGRCKKVPWLQTAEEKEAALEITATSPDLPTAKMFDQTTSPTDLTMNQNPGLQTNSPVRNRFLSVGMLPEAHQSALSVHEVAAHSEKPGVLSPSRRRGENGTGSPPARSPFLAGSEVDDDS